MATIVAIGGGGIRQSRFTSKTLVIDQAIVSLAGKPLPRVLFVPTASNDNPDYSHSFYEYYTHSLKCQVDVLALTTRPTLAAMTQAVRAADIIYIGGGDTFRMMRVWRKTGFDRVLAGANRTDKVLAGVSAGAICWFEAGISDSRRYTHLHGRSWPYINVHGLNAVRGLDLHKLILCPHYDSEPRRHTALRHVLKHHDTTGIALEECVALVIKDGMYRILTADTNQKAYKAYWKDSKYFLDSLEATTAWEPLTTLMARSKHTG